MQATWHANHKQLVFHREGTVPDSYEDLATYPEAESFCSSYALLNGTPIELSRYSSSTPDAIKWRTDFDAMGEEVTV